MTKTQRINRLYSQISAESSALQSRLAQLDNRRSKLNRIAKSIDEPHALIPNSCRSVEEWIEGHPFPSAVIANVFPNYATAFDASHFSIFVEMNYHVAPCESREYYRLKYMNNERGKQFE